MNASGSANTTPSKSGVASVGANGLGGATPTPAGAAAVSGGPTSIGPGGGGTGGGGPGKLEEWPEEKILESMKKLEEMHTKLKHLRSLIPRMIQPLTEDYDTRMYTHIPNISPSRRRKGMD